MSGNVISQTTTSCYKWEIKPFCVGSKNVGSSIDSPEFSTQFSGVVSRWKLQLYPNGHDNYSKDYLALYVYYLGYDTVTPQITLSLLDDKHSTVVTSQLTKPIFDSKNGWGFPNFVSKQFVIEEKNRVLLQDTLKIQCEISFSDPIYASEKIPQTLLSLVKKNKEDPLICRLQEFEDFEKLLENGNLSDITIIAGGKNFQAHKAIITSRSTVFEAMFKHDMKEKEQNIIEITDIKPEIMKEVLRFIYAGKVNGVEKIAPELLIASEKYSIIGLKKLCIQTMFETLEIGNALEFLKLADMYNAADLRSRVIEFIADNQKTIAAKPEFGLFTDLHSELQLELVRAIIAKNSTQ